MARQSKSSFCGRIYEIPGIFVDNFEKTGSRAYFLSHCHTDHTQGLYSGTFLEYLKQNDIFIYMSEASAAIVRHESFDKSISEYIRPLKLGVTSTIAIPSDLNSDEEYIEVTLIPAGHCFGSVMFLFRTLQKTVLYTGDFRISVNSVSKYAELHENGDIIKLDALYVDTTFQDGRYVDFPKRSESVDYVIEEIKQWLGKHDGNQVALHTSAKYGYEFLFNEIFDRLHLKVYVDEDKWIFYSKMAKLVPGVTNDTKTRIHLCRNRYREISHDICVKKETLLSKESCQSLTTDVTISNKGKQVENLDGVVQSKSCHEENTDGAFLYIHFSAMKWQNYNTDDKMINFDKKSNSIDVCFATHCSRSELLYFVNYLSPKRIVGFPEPYNEMPRRKDTPFKRKQTGSHETNIKVCRKPVF